MRRHLVLALCFGSAACAEILGIDDGKARTYEDGSVDASSSDVTVIPDAGPKDAPADVPIDVPVSKLACGKTTCNAIVEACCRTGDPVDASAQSFTCIAANAACDGGLLLPCVETANCTAQGHVGEICCAETPDGSIVATSVACVAPNACGGAKMCEPGDDELCTPDAQSCQPSSMTVVGFMICK